MEDDEKWMKEAVETAKLGMAAGECPVACVFVGRDGKELARGHNETNIRRNATLHAELVVADRLGTVLGAEAAADALNGATLYVTVEPCVMCAAALLHFGLRRVVFGAANPRFGGCGSVMQLHTHAVPDRPQLKPYVAVGGEQADVAVALLKSFYEQHNPATGGANARKNTPKRPRRAEQMDVGLHSTSVADSDPIL